MHKPYTSYNPWFLIPFSIWVVAGAAFIFTTGDESIFRFINLNHTPFLDVLMYNSTMLGEGMVIALVLLVLMGKSKLRNWWYIIAALLSSILPSVLTQVVKRSMNSPRPLKFFGDTDWIHVLPHWPRHMENSFPSGHTCGAFAFFTFLAILLPARYRAWGLILFVLAMLVAYSRIYLAVHFMSDVYAGSILGTGFTLIIISLMNRYQAVFFKK